MTVIGSQCLFAESILSATFVYKDLSFNIKMFYYRHGCLVMRGLYMSYVGCYCLRKIENQENTIENSLKFVEKIRISLKKFIHCWLAGTLLYIAFTIIKAFYRVCCIFFLQNTLKVR